MLTCGYDPGQPVPAADALAGCLRALGVATHDIPAGIDERAATYRTLLNGRRVLVVLDNAATVEQVRPLLPGSPNCVVVVTSRDSLAGLVTRHGARRLDLDLLPPGEAVGLLRTLIGDRVDAEPGAADALARLCACPPLALRDAAEFAIARPSMTLSQLGGELADGQRLLDLLDPGGDPRAALRSVFSRSYRYLSADTARAFRLLGLHPGPGFAPCAAAALTGTTLAQSRRVLDLLARAHLIQQARQGRYGMHGLLLCYAAQMASAEDSEDEWRAALTRLFDHWQQGCDKQERPSAHCGPPLPGACRQGAKQLQVARTFEEATIPFGGNLLRGPVPMKATRSSPKPGSKAAEQKVPDPHMASWMGPASSKTSM